MTTIKSTTDLSSITDGADLPRPDLVSAVASSDTDSRILRQGPSPNVDDSGRISFGAACRLPMRK